MYGLPGHPYSSSKAGSAAGGGASGGSWKEKWEVDFTGSDAKTISTNGGHAIERGGTQYETVVFSENGSQAATFTAGANGLAFARGGGASGHTGLSFDMMQKFGFSAPASNADFGKAIAIQHLITHVGFNGANSERAHFGISAGTSTPLNNAGFIAASIKDDNTYADLGIYTGSDKDVQLNTAYATSYLATIILRGAVAEVFMEVGATDFQEPRTEAFGPWLAYRGIVTGAMTPRYRNNFWATVIGRRKVNFTWAKCRGLVFE